MSQIEKEAPVVFGSQDSGDIFLKGLQSGILISIILTWIGHILLSLILMLS